MKQTKKVTRAQRTYLERKGIKREILEKFRFYANVGNEPIFCLDGVLIKWCNTTNSFEEVHKDGTFVTTDL